MGVGTACVLGGTIGGVVGCAVGCAVFKPQGASPSLGGGQPMRTSAALMYPLIGMFRLFSWLFLVVSLFLTNVASCYFT